MIQAAITKRGFIWTLLIEATRGPGKMRTSHVRISLKERPEKCAQVKT